MVNRPNQTINILRFIEKDSKEIIKAVYPTSTPNKSDFVKGEKISFTLGHPDNLHKAQFVNEKWVYKYNKSTYAIVDSNLEIKEKIDAKSNPDDSIVDTYYVLEVIVEKLLEK